MYGDENYGRHRRRQMGGADARTNQVEQAISTGAGVPAGRQPVRMPLAWQYYFDPAGRTSSDFNIANLQAHDTVYPTFVTKTQGVHYPFIMGVDGKMSQTYEAIMQNIYIQWSPSFTDNMVNILWIQGALLVIKIAGIEFYRTRLDLLGSPYRPVQGFKARGTPFAGPFTSYVQQASISPFGGGLKQSIWVNSKIPGVKLEPNTELDIHITMPRGYGPLSPNANIATVFTDGGLLTTPIPAEELWFAVVAEAIVTKPQGG